MMVPRAATLFSALALCCTSPGLLAQPLDGAWSGVLRCSENLLNRNPPYGVDLSLQITGTTARAERTDAVSVESFWLQRQPSGVIELQSSGRLRADASPRWTTRLAGRAAGSDRLEFTGQMFSPDGRLVRERCDLALVRQAAPPAEPAARTAAADHRSHRVLEVAPRVPPRRAAATSAGPGGLPLGEGGALYLPEDWLLGAGQAWHHRTRPRGGAVPVPVRSPSPEEARVIEQVRTLLQQVESRVVALVADGEIVEVVTTGGIGFDTRLLSASMAKTVAALAAGRAVCAGRLRMDSRADAVVPALAGTDLGAATLRDLLTMASGTTEPSGRDYVGTTAEETARHLEGPGNLEQLLATPAQSTAQRGLFSKVRPGERFSYKSRDPYTVAMMIERSVGMPATQWVEEQVLGAFQAEHPAVLATDRSGYFHGANGAVRLALIDWIRLAIHVDAQRRTDTCFGRFVRDMGTTQIRAEGVTSHLSGYGYFTWTDNALAPATFWAVGYGGQRIGWSTDPANGRIFLVFSNSADRHMDVVYAIARGWFALGQKR